MKYPVTMLLTVLIATVCPFAAVISDCQAMFVNRCMDDILNGGYDRAVSVADSAMRADTRDPLSPLIKLTAIGVRDVDFDTLIDSSGFVKAYETAVTRITNYEKANGVSSYTLMLNGFCKGLNASFYLRLESYYTAMKTGFEALDLLNKAHEFDTANADALFFPGLYDYARGELKKRLWWVLFWYPGSKEKGIARLGRCAEQGTLTAGAARLALADIYVREKKLPAALRVIKQLEGVVPESRFVLWARAKYEEALPDPAKAADAFGALAKSYAVSGKNGHFNMLATQSLEASQLARAGKNTQAAEICRIILPKAIGRRNKVIYNDTEKLLRRLDHDRNH